MGNLLGTNLAKLKQDANLDDEELEELKMVSVFDDKKICELKMIFDLYDLNADGELTPEEFVGIPEIMMNPLKGRILYCCTEFGPSIDFKEFVTFMSVFSEEGPRAEKLRYAFKIYDVDGDGKVDEGDLIAILNMVTKFDEEQFKSVEEGEEEDAADADKEENGVEGKEAEGEEEKKADEGNGNGNGDENTAEEKRSEEKTGKKEGANDENEEGEDQEGEDEDDPSKKDRPAFMSDKNLFFKEVARRTIMEASSNGHWLTFDDFTKAIFHGDFQQKLTINFVSHSERELRMLEAKLKADNEAAKAAEEAKNKPAGGANSNASKGEAKEDEGGAAARDELDDDDDDTAGAVAAAGEGGDGTASSSNSTGAGGETREAPAPVGEGSEPGPTGADLEAGEGGGGGVTAAEDGEDDTEEV